MKRLSLDDCFIGSALWMSTRATCARRRVGCVLVDQNNLVMSTGFNGPASGLPHCIDVPCDGASLPSGTGLSTCQAIHAEANALMQCRDVHKIKSCYSTTAPCTDCIKLLLNTSCESVIYLDEYPGTEINYNIWITSRIGRTWKKWTPNNRASSHMIESVKSLIGITLA